MNTFFPTHKSKTWMMLLLIATVCIPIHFTLAQDQGFSMDFLGPNSTIEVAEEGTFSINSDANGEVTEAIFKVGVIVRSDQLNLDCDTLIYTVKKKTIVAEGNPVIIKQGGGINATCRHFRYNTETGKAILTGKPIIKQKGGNEVTGKKIILIQNKDGKTQILVDSGKIISGGTSKSTNRRKPRAKNPEVDEPGVIIVRDNEPDEPKVKTAGSNSPIPITSKTISKIPELDLDDDI